MNTDTLTVSGGPIFTIAPNFMPTLTIGKVVINTETGAVDLGGTTPDEAAREFWLAVETTCATQLGALKAEVARLKSLNPDEVALLKARP